MNIDFNALVVLNSVIECRSVTRAAQQLSTSPSSVTYSINKLRKLTNNPIVNRTKDGVEPTTLALILNERYKKAIALIRSGLMSGDSPPESDYSHKITISTFSFLELWLSLTLLKGNTFRENTEFNFAIHSSNAELRLSRLRNRETDIDIGSPLPNDSSIVSYKLFNSGYKAMVRDSHPSIKDTLSLEQWNLGQHVNLGDLQNNLGQLFGNYSELIELKNRNFIIETQSTLNMVALCAFTDCIMLVPAYFEDILCNALPVKMFDLPFETNIESTVYLHYHLTAIANSTLMKNIQAIKILSGNYQ